MYFAFLFWTVLYGAVTLLFLILSWSEMLKDNVSTPARVLTVLLTSVFWPAKLAAVTIYTLYWWQRSRMERSSRQPMPLLKVAGLSQLKLGGTNLTVRRGI